MLKASSIVPEYYFDYHIGFMLSINHQDNFSLIILSSQLDNCQTHRNLLYRSERKGEPSQWASCIFFLLATAEQEYLCQISFLFRTLSLQHLKWHRKNKKVWIYLHLHLVTRVMYKCTKIGKGAALSTPQIVVFCKPFLF